MFHLIFQVYIIKRESQRLRKQFSSLNLICSKKTTLSFNRWSPFKILKDSKLPLAIHVKFEQGTVDSLMLIKGFDKQTFLSRTSTVFSPYVVALKSKITLRNKKKQLAHDD